MTLRYPAVAFVVLLALAPRLDAQVQWNRKVEAVAMVPGSIPGAFMVHAAVSVADFTTGTVPNNLSFGLDLLINGTAVTPKRSSQPRRRQRPRTVVGECAGNGIASASCWPAAPSAGATSS